jgi:hypothetical protein
MDSSHQILGDCLLLGCTSQTDYIYTILCDMETVYRHECGSGFCDARWAGDVSVWRKAGSSMYYGYYGYVETALAIVLLDLDCPGGLCRELIAGMRPNRLLPQINRDVCGLT